MNRNTHAPGRKSSASNRDAINRRADDALATAGRDSAFPESEATPQVLSSAKNNFRLVEEVLWQLSGARQTAADSQKGERRGVYQFYNPFCDVRCLVEMLAPYTALRSTAFLQSEASPQVVSAAKGNRGDISTYGQNKLPRWQCSFGLVKFAPRVRLRRKQPNQSNAATRRLAIMNLAIRGIEADFGKEHADTFRAVQHPDFCANCVLSRLKMIRSGSFGDEFDSSLHV